MNDILKDRIKLLSAIKKAYNEMMKEERYKNDVGSIKEILKLIRANKEEFLSISQEDKQLITYAKNEKDKYNTKTRIQTTFGRYVRRRLYMDESKISHETLDVLTANIKNIIFESDLDQQIKVINGGDIIEQYRTSKAVSCMTGNECEKVELYALNPDKVSLVMHDTARALLWKTNEDKFVLDRVYPAQCHSVKIIRQWATLKGYVLRTNPDKVINTGSKATLSDRKIHSVTLKHRGIFPYMDTFSYGLYGSEVVTVKNNPKFGNMILHSVHGEYELAKICCNCDCRVNDGDYNHIADDGIYCLNCFNKMFFCCDCCGDYHLVSKSDKLILPSGHYLCKNCKECKSIVVACKNCKIIDFKSNMALDNDQYCCYNCYSDIRD